MKDCIFCKIINGEIPSYTIYEDDMIKVFLDVNPVTNGHMLIIPKKHYKDLYEMDKEVLIHSINTIKEKLSPLVKEKLNCDGVTIVQNNGYGQEVKHYHIHLIPRYDSDQVELISDKDKLIDTKEIFTMLKEK